MRHRHKLVVIANGSRAGHWECVSAASDSFWPDVSNSQSQEDWAGRENSPGRVLREVLLVLGVAAVVAGAAALWIPVMP